MTDPELESEIELRQEDGAYRLEFSAKYQTQHIHRSVAVQSCEEGMEAAVLFILLILENGVDQAAADDGEALPKPAPAQREPEQQSPAQGRVHQQQRMAFRLGAGVIVDPVLLPQFAVGPRLESELYFFRGLGVALGVHWFPSSKTRHEEEVELRLGAVGADLAVVKFWKWHNLELGPRLGGGVDVVAGEASGTSVSASRARTVTATIQAGLHVGGRLNRRLLVQGAALIAVPTRRQEFYVTQGETLHTIPAWTGRGYLGVSYEF